MGWKESDEMESDGLSRVGTVCVRARPTGELYTRCALGVYAVCSVQSPGCVRICP